MSPRGTTELRRLDAKAEEFLDFMINLYERLKDNQHDSNQRYKDIEDKRRRHKNFEVLDEVMVYLKKNRFPIGTYIKMKMKKFGPLRILKKNDRSEYFEVEFPEDMDISLVFNISYIFEYYETNEETSEKHDYTKKKTKGIYRILDTRISKGETGKDYKEYLVQW